MPDCIVVIYNHEYKLNVASEVMIEVCNRLKNNLLINFYFFANQKNFTVKELELIKSYLFEEILELYDLKWKGYNIDENSCNRFHLMPRFCRTLPCKCFLFFISLN
jgi:hypothetical protein